VVASPFCAPVSSSLSRHGRHGGRVTVRSYGVMIKGGRDGRPLVAVPGRECMTGCVMPGPKCAVSRWPPPDSGCKVSLLPDALASGSHGRPLSGALGALPVRFTGPEKERHETPSGLHRHGTGLVSTPCVVRDLVRAACRRTSTPPSSDSGRSDQQGPPSPRSATSARSFPRAEATYNATPVRVAFLNSVRALQARVVLPVW